MLHGACVHCVPEVYPAQPILSVTGWGSTHRAWRADKAHSVQPLSSSLIGVEQALTRYVSSFSCCSDLTRLTLGLVTRPASLSTISTSQLKSAHSRRSSAADVISLRASRSVVSDDAVRRFRGAGAVVAVAADDDDEGEKGVAERDDSASSSSARRWRTLAACMFWRHHHQAERSAAARVQLDSQRVSDGRTGRKRFALMRCALLTSAWPRLARFLLSMLAEELGSLASLRMALLFVSLAGVTSSPRRLMFLGGGARVLRLAPAAAASVARAVPDVALPAAADDTALLALLPMSVCVSLCVYVG